MSSTLSPSMNLIIPGVGTEQSPTYAFDINSSLTLVDQHDHTFGKGVQITPAGLNINADLNMNGFSLISALTVVFDASTTPSTTPMSLSIAPGGESPQQQDLWYTPDTGIPIQITKNGQVNVVASSIDGESYAAGTFFWTQAQDALPTTPANFDIGSVTIRPNVALTTFGVTISPPSSITSQYSIFMPLLPTSQKIMTLDASGNMSAPYTVDGSTITISSNVIGVPAGGITNTQIAMNTITGNRLVNGTIGYDQLAPGFNGTWNTQTFTITQPAFNVRVATTVNGTLSTAFDNGSPIDGVTIATNDLILIKNQTVSTDNGVYVVQASGAPVRSTSYDTFGELNYAGVHVTAGTINSNTNWFQNNILTSLSDPQSWSNSSTQAFVVPSNVNKILAKISGGGGGAGAGAGNSATGAGGAGGNGSPATTMILDVTPGETISITVGAGGLGGTGVTASPGNPGATGGTSSIIGSLSKIYIGGASGGAAGASTTPGVAGTTSYTPRTINSGGGAGAANGSIAGGAGTDSATGNGGAGGTGGLVVGTPGGGGGGGAGAGDGGHGANATSTNPGPAGTSAADGTGAGGGGGGGANNAGGGVGGRGGNGGYGLVEIAWIGAPS